MKAAIMPEVGKIELVDIDMPTMQEDEVMVKVKACLLYTSELNIALYM